MGSGCNPNKNLSICLDPIGSDCVKSMTSPEPSLNICTGDTLTEVLQTLINRITNLTVDGKDISLNSLILSLCHDIENLVGNQPKTVLNVIQALVQYSCVLKTRIDVIQQQIIGSIGTGTIDFKCIQAPTQYSVTNALQVIINSHCDLETEVNNLINNSGSTTIIDGRINIALNSLITGIGNYGIKKTVSPTTQQPTYQLLGLVPPQTALPYFGSLSNFDSSGKGLAGKLDGWYLCNGNNGTPDMRGYTPVGAIQGVPGGALGANVNPATDASMNYALNSTGGNTKITVTSSNIPAHTHPVVDPGHTHNIVTPSWTNRVQGGGGGVLSPTDVDGRRTTLTTNLSYTGITVGTNVTSNTPIDVRQPYRACNFIMRFD